MQNDLVGLRRQLTEMLRRESEALETARALSASSADSAAVHAALELAESLRKERSKLAEELRRREFAGR